MDPKTFRVTFTANDRNRPSHGCAGDYLVLASSESDARARMMARVRSAFGESLAAQGIAFDDLVFSFERVVEVPASVAAELAPLLRGPPLN